MIEQLLVTTYLVTCFTIWIKLIDDVNRRCYSLSKQIYGPSYEWVIRDLHHVMLTIVTRVKKV